MTSYNTNELKNGLKILIDGNPNIIIDNDFVNPGKGQAFNRLKLKNLINSRVIEKTFKSGESIEAADIDEINATYSYFDGDNNYVFIHPETFEEYFITTNALGDTKKWLNNQDEYEIILFNGLAISVTAPNFVNLKIINTDPGLKGNTIGTSGKPATLSTGVIIKVPLFIETGSMIKVDTRKSIYTSRVKNL